MIFFDIDDTLFNHSKAQNKTALFFWDKFSDRLAYSRLEFPDVWNKVMQKHFDAFAAGEISFQEHRRRRIEEIFGLEPESLSMDVAVSFFDVYLKHYEASWELFHDVEPCLESLNGVKLGIISNGNGEQQRQKLAQLGIAAKSTTIVISDEIGVSKPNPEIFHEACRRASITAQECIFVGDNLKVDAQASTAAGMRGIWLNRYSLEVPDTGVSVIRNLKELVSMRVLNRS